MQPGFIGSLVLMCSWCMSCIPPTLLCLQVSEFYSRCCGLLEGAGVCVVIGKKNKDWPKLLKFKVFYYQAIAHVNPTFTTTDLS